MQAPAACGIDDAYTHAHAIHIPTSHVTTHSIHAGSPRCVTYLWKEALIALAQGQNRSMLEEEIKGTTQTSMSFEKRILSKNYL